MDWVTFRKHCVLAVFNGILAYTILACYLFGDTWFLLNDLCFALFLIPPTLYFFMRTHKNRQLCLSLLGLIWLPSLALFVTSLFSSWLGMALRGYFLVGGGLLAIPFFGLVFAEIDDKSTDQVLSFTYLTRLTLLSSVVTVAFVYSHYSYVYYEAPMSKLIKKVDKGPYTGIYTTVAVDRTLTFIAAEMREWTKESEFIALWDTAPIAYAMSKAKLCSPSVWDGLKQHTTTSQSVYSNFLTQSDCTPNKIIGIKVDLYQTDWAADQYAAAHGYKLIHERSIENIGIKIFERTN